MSTIVVHPGDELIFADLGERCLGEAQVFRLADSLVRVCGVASVAFRAYRSEPTEDVA